MFEVLHSSTPVSFRTSLLQTEASFFNSYPQFLVFLALATADLLSFHCIQNRSYGLLHGCLQVTFFAFRPHLFRAGEREREFRGLASSVSDLIFISHLVPWEHRTRNSPWSLLSVAQNQPQIFVQLNLFCTSAHNMTPVALGSHPLTVRVYSAIKNFSW